MTDTRYLVHGVFWDGPPASTPADDAGGPVLRLQSPEGDFRELSLRAGSRLGFGVRSAGPAAPAPDPVLPSPSEATPGEDDLSPLDR